MVSETMIPLELVEALAAKTKTNEIQWSVTKGRTFSTELPDCKLSLTTSDPGIDTPDIAFEVDTPDGAVIGIIEVKVGHPYYEEMRQLLTSAESSFRDRLDKILRRAAISIKETSSSTSTTPPPMPPPPSSEQAQTFFKRIAGEWFLSFSRGIETLRIDIEGNYFTYPPKHANEPGVQPLLKYRFKLEHCDPDMERVELSKRELDGRVRQLEVLSIAPLTMTGYAKHDAHVLRYSRNEWFQCHSKSESQPIYLRALNPEDAKEVFKRARGIRSTPYDTTVLKCQGYTPSAADLELDKTLYPDSPFR